MYSLRCVCSAVTMNKNIITIIVNIDTMYRCDLTIIFTVQEYKHHSIFTILDNVFFDIPHSNTMIVHNYNMGVYSITVYVYIIHIHVFNLIKHS